MKNKGVTAKKWLERNGFNSDHIITGHKQGVFVKEGRTRTEIQEILRDPSITRRNEKQEDTTLTHENMSLSQLTGRQGLRGFGLVDPMSREKGKTPSKRSYSQIPKWLALRSEDGRLICFPEGDGTFTIGISSHFDKSLAQDKKRLAKDYLLPGMSELFLDRSKRQKVLKVTALYGDQLTPSSATYMVRGDLT